MEDTVRDIKGNLYRLQLNNLNPQQVSAVKSLLQKSEITPALVASVVSTIQQAPQASAGAGCSRCGGGANALAVGGEGSIKRMDPAVCPGAKMVGQAISLTSTPTGGTAPYTIEFRRNGVTLSGGSFTGVPEGSPRSINYTLVAGDVPSVTISVYITDSCPTGAQTNTDQCVVTVGSCNVPSCGFVVT